VQTAIEPAADPERRVPTRREHRRWRQNLADERAEAAVYRDLASRRTGEERDILLALAEAEGRHEQHWLDLLGDDVGRPLRGDFRTVTLAWMARRFGSVFVLALAQRAEARSSYDTDADATATMAADERIHEEVVRGLAARGRNRMSGQFRAAVFGANDGLVSNLALVLGIGASGASNSTVLLTGVAGLLAGALSMGAGEYVSVRSQRELLEASSPGTQANEAVPHLDVEANELELVYRARGMSVEDARIRAGELLRSFGTIPTSTLGVPRVGPDPVLGPDGPARTDAAPVAHPVDRVDPVDEHEAIGTAFGAAGASFCFFASGAIIPVLPYLLGLGGLRAVLIATFLVGIALLCTGAAVGVLSGGPPVRRALRQLAIGFGAAATTYVLGLLFGSSV
jgi:VIT1/CCC1 family predicted Fe2+/Mn2+ transporter